MLHIAGLISVSGGKDKILEFYGPGKYMQEGHMSYSRNDCAGNAIGPTIRVMLQLHSSVIHQWPVLLPNTFKSGPLLSLTHPRY